MSDGPRENPFSPWRTKQLYPSLPHQMFRSPFFFHKSTKLNDSYCGTHEFPSSSSYGSHQINHIRGKLRFQKKLAMQNLSYPELHKSTKSSIGYFTTESGKKIKALKHVKPSHAENTSRGHCAWFKDNLHLFWKKYDAKCIILRGDGSSLWQTQSETLHHVCENQEQFHLCQQFTKACTFSCKKNRILLGDLHPCQQTFPVSRQQKSNVNEKNRYRERYLLFRERIIYCRRYYYKRALPFPSNVMVTLGG